MRIVISGVSGCRNRGVEALVQSIIAEGTDTLPGAEWTVLSADPEYDRTVLPATVLPDPFYIGPLAALRGLSSLTRSLSRAVEDWTLGGRAIAGADALVVTGGDLFGTDYGTYASCLGPPRLARRHGVPVSFHAHSIGPFKDYETAAPWVREASHAAVLTLREHRSLQHVIDLGIPPSACRYSADPAFLLRPSSGSGLIEHYRFFGDARPLAAVSPSQGITTFADLSSDAHLHAWTVLTRFLIDRLNMNVLLVPHAQERYPLNDDRVLATRIHASLGYDRRVRLVGGDHSAADFKALIGGADLLVAERQHAAIAGLSSLVPTMVVGYSVKAVGILETLLPEDPTEMGCLIGVPDFVREPAKARNSLLRLWDRRSETKDALAVSVPQAMADARSSFQLLADAIQAGSQEANDR